MATEQNVTPDVLAGGFSSIGASTLYVSPTGVDLHEQAVLAATKYLVADTAHMQAQLPCTPPPLPKDPG